MVQLGHLLRDARKSRNLTQNDLAKGIVSRTTISKIETGEQDPAFSTVMSLLDRMGITVDELFSFNHDSYDFLYHDVLHKFKSLYYSTQEEHINCLLSEINYLEKQKHSDILSNIRCVLIAFKKIDDLPISDLQKIVSPVWHQLEKVNKWTVLDLYLINHLLFFFDDSTAEKMVMQAISNIDKYYLDLRSLKNSFISNIAYLYIKTGQFNKALHYANTGVALSKALKRYDLVLLNKIRITTIKGDKDAQHYYLTLLESMNDVNFVHGLEEEIRLIEGDA